MLEYIVEGNNMYTIKLPDVGEKGFYRHRVSLNSFRTRCLKGKYKKDIKKQVSSALNSCLFGIDELSHKTASKILKESSEHLGVMLKDSKGVANFKTLEPTLEDLSIITRIKFN